MIRYNDELGRYEGYNNGNWLALSGVEDADGNTYITAELTPGANDNTIRFYTDGSLMVTVDNTKLFAERLQTTNLNIQDNTISSISTNSDINLTATGTGSVNIQLNGNTGSSWSVTAFWGTGTTLLSGRATSRNVATTGGHQAGIVPLLGSMSTTINHILNYRSTDMFKTILSRFAQDREGTGENSVSANLWPFTPAVTQLNVSTGSAWSIGSTFALYGVRSVSQ
jgi:hypothetical protein